MKITSLLITAAAALTLVSCETTGSGTTGNSASYSGSKSRTVKVLFKGSFTDKEKSAVLRGMNNSLGSKRYGVGFSEYRGGGYPSGKFVSVKWFSHTLETKIIGHHGLNVNGFYMTGGFRLIGINDKLRGRGREIQYVCEHEADHAFGRMHLTAKQRKALGTMRMGGGVLPSMDWGQWPSKPVM